MLKLNINNCLCHNKCLIDKSNTSVSGSTVVLSDGTKKNGRLFISIASDELKLT